MIPVHPFLKDIAMPPLDDRIRTALQTDRLIDFTTTGRKSGKPHRRETWMHQTRAGLILTGSPGKRDWYANLLANPHFTLHLKQSAEADLPATATPVTDPAARREIFTEVLERIGRPASDLDKWMQASPLMQVSIDGM
jgi:deazaflavin-dependent oxidoreductase (nitroreductase family)